MLSNKKFALILACAAMAASTACNEAAEYCDGANRCDGDVLTICENNKVVEVVDCSADKKTCDAEKLVCVASTPTQDECKAGEVSCKGSIILTCGSDNKWVEGKDCSADDKICQNGKCENKPVTPVCQAGETKCENNAESTCTVDGQWGAPTNCGEGEKCGEKACEPSTAECSKGETKCEDNAEYSCTDSGMWSNPTSCGQGEVCGEKACEDEPVTITACNAYEGTTLSNGESKCVGNVLVSCTIEDGAKVAPDASVDNCADQDDYICDTEKNECVENLETGCTVDDKEVAHKEKTCTSSSASVYVCNDGTLDTSEECYDGAECEDVDGSLQCYKPAPEDCTIEGQVVTHGNGICVGNVYTSCNYGTPATNTCDDATPVCDASIVEHCRAYKDCEDGELKAKHGESVCSADAKSVLTCEDGVFADAKKVECAEYESCQKGDASVSCVDTRKEYNTIKAIKDDFDTIKAGGTESSGSITMAAKVNVKGVVTAIRSKNKNLFIQDGDDVASDQAAGIYTYNSVALDGFAVGDNVDLTADKVAIFNGQLELLDVTLTKNSNTATVTAAVVKIADILETNVGEAKNSKNLMLVKVEGVTTNGSVLTDADSKSIAVSTYIYKATADLNSTFKYDVTGIVNYNYQAAKPEAAADAIAPRSANDIVIVGCADEKQIFTAATDKEAAKCEAPVPTCTATDVSECTGTIPANSTHSCDTSGEKGVCTWSCNPGFHKNEAKDACEENAPGDCSATPNRSVCQTIDGSSWRVYCDGGNSIEKPSDMGTLNCTAIDMVCVETSADAYCDVCSATDTSMCTGTIPEHSTRACIDGGWYGNECGWECEPGYKTNEAGDGCVVEAESCTASVCSAESYKKCDGGKVVETVAKPGELYICEEASGWKAVECIDTCASDETYTKTCKNNVCEATGCVDTTKDFDTESKICKTPVSAGCSEDSVTYENNGEYKCVTTTCVKGKEPVISVSTTASCTAGNAGVGVCIDTTEKCTDSNTYDMCEDGVWGKNVETCVGGCETVGDKTGCKSIGTPGDYVCDGTVLKVIDKAGTGYEASSVDCATESDGPLCLDNKDGNATCAACNPAEYVTWCEGGKTLHACVSGAIVDTECTCVDDGDATTPDSCKTIGTPKAYVCVDNVLKQINDTGSNYVDDGFDCKTETETPICVDNNDGKATCLACNPAKYTAWCDATKQIVTSCDAEGKLAENNCPTGCTSDGDETTPDSCNALTCDPTKEYIPWCNASGDAVTCGADGNIKVQTCLDCKSGACACTDNSDCDEAAGEKCTDSVCVAPVVEAKNLVVDFTKTCADLLDSKVATACDSNEATATKAPYTLNITYANGIKLTAISNNAIAAKGFVGFGAADHTLKLENLEGGSTIKYSTVEKKTSTIKVDDGVTNPAHTFDNSTSVRTDELTIASTADSIVFSRSSGTAWFKINSLEVIAPTK